MGRRIRTDIPQVKDNFIPKWRHIQNLKELDEKYKQSQKDNYDTSHRVKTLPMLPENQAVWVDTRGHQVPGQILQTVETPHGELRRNQAHLHIRTDTQLPDDTSSTETALSQPVTIRTGPVTCSQTGTVLRPPDRLQY